MMRFVLEKAASRQYPWLCNPLVKACVDYVGDASEELGAGWMICTLAFYYNYRRLPFCRVTYYFNFDRYQHSFVDFCEVDVKTVKFLSGGV